jgi:glycosyltransferase involved in cell wall biosynthesis
MNDLVSIITPSFNTAQFIRQTIDSVLSQTYTNWEMIIVDDCSKDDTEAIVAEYADSRIRFLKNEKNSGAAVSRNRALREAKGKWVAFLDSDDLWVPTKLEKQIRFMEEKNCHFSYTNYTEIDDDGNSLGTLWTGPKKISRLCMRSFNYMGCLTVMYDREYVGLIQIADLKKRNDYAMWVKVAEKCPAYLLDETLAIYRVRGSGSIMNRSKGPLSRLKFNYYMWRDGEEMAQIPALAWTGVNLVCGAMKKVLYKKQAD